MAAKARQSKLCRYISFSLSIFLIPGALALAGDIAPSSYVLFGGDQFFLLSETTFSSDEYAVVRLEAPSGNREVLEAYSGVDIRVYRVPNPPDFLKKQKNLHRPQIEGNYAGEGLANALNYLWDSWYKKSRLAWQRIFSFPTRRVAVENTPELHQAPPHSYHTQFKNHPQFNRVAGLDLVDEFRYPIWNARPISPPRDVSLSGSSSDFIRVEQGNVFIPLGQRRPGLYLVEALIGSFRATTFVFVSDTIAITKISDKQLLVWTVHKKTGLPVANTKLLVTDGVGKVGSGVTRKDGMFLLNGKSLERSYVIGSDTSGGIFVSENFYYASEIYSTKLYAFTDRPLYRPGDTVYLKLLGREFKNSSRSLPLAEAPATIVVMDPGGTPIIVKQTRIASGIDGGDTSFQLPDLAAAGGYTLQILYNNNRYAGFIRVANYVKPHFEIDVTFGKREFVTNEPINGQIKVTYPNGDPVRSAKIQIDVRKQNLTIVEGELQYLDRFPVQVLKQDFTANDRGLVKFVVPAATDPSRYIFHFRCIDHTSYRVTSTREILVQASVGILTLKSEKNFSSPNEPVVFNFGRTGNEPETAVDPTVSSWEAIRLQDQSKTSGKIPEGQTSFSITFEKAGSYTVSVRHREGSLLGSISHWVRGPELAGIPGTISILLDQNEYAPGDTARLLVTFSEKINDALVTIERDKIERHTLLSTPTKWIKLTQLSDQQWQGEMQIEKAFSPNIIFSIAYVLDGKYYFENKGIKVSSHKIQIQFHSDKERYQPGETVHVKVKTTLKGRPIESNVTVSVVDEMVYVLQPETAPDISDFFYHLRRNQVRTSSSLRFHSFDAAVSATGAKPSNTHIYNERGLKLRERPRREEKDTAFWAPTIKTDRNGNAKFSFVMPDSVTRWRISGRAMSTAGIVGQAKAFLASSKDYYLKWTGPTIFRFGDSPAITMVAFNLGQSSKTVTFEAKGMSTAIDRKVTLQPGSNYLGLPLKAERDGNITVRLKLDNQVVDALETPITVVPNGWASTYTIPIHGKSSASAIPIPSGAWNIRLTTASSVADGFLRAVDYLVDYPYGCVEQTASRLLPLGLAYTLIQKSGHSESVKEHIQDHLARERLRLIKMAGPEAAFSWWGDQTRQSAFMTSYAYFADWTASTALNLNLPPTHWEHVLEVYKKSSSSESVFQKSVILWLASEMGLPTKTLSEGVIETLSAVKTPRGTTELQKAHDVSYLLTEEGQSLQFGMALVLLNVVAESNKLSLGNTLAQKLPEARKLLAESENPLAESILLLEKRGSELEQEDRKLADNILDRLIMEMPTVDRSLSLIFLSRSMGLATTLEQGSSGLDLGKDWIKTESRLGRPVWQYRGQVAGSIRIPQELGSHKDVSAHLVYESYSKEESRLPIAIERRLYQLKQKEKALEFDAVQITGNWQLDLSEIYVDEIKLQPLSGQVFKFGLLEVALPAGAEVEQTTWGMIVNSSDGKPVPIGDPSFQQGQRSYSVAVESLNSPLTVRHLVRFSQTGSFQIPPVRFFRMYAPNEKAIEGGTTPEFREITVR